MFELPLDITYIEKNNKCQYLRRQSFENQRIHAEEQRRNYLISRNERNLRRGRVSTLHDQTGRRYIIRRALTSQDIMESKEDVMYDEDFTHFSMFGNGDYFIFSADILHPYWSERFPQWRDNPVYILNAIQHVLETWDHNTLLSPIRSVTQRDIYVHQLHQWLVYQLWQNPFLTLAEVTEMIQQRQLNIRIPLDNINPHTHWTRNELEQHRVHIIDPTGISERELGELTIFSMRDRQRALMRQLQSYDIQLLQIRQHINPHEGSMIHIFTSRIV
jgi:hypothetical protein